MGIACGPRAKSTRHGVITFPSRRFTSQKARRTNGLRGVSMGGRRSVGCMVVTSRSGVVAMGAAPSEVERRQAREERTDREAEEQARHAGFRGAVPGTAAGR